MKTIKETDSEYICDMPAPCFQELSNDDKLIIKSSKTQVLYRKGDNLTKQGTFASYVMFVIKGFAKQYIENEDEKSYNLRIIQAGEFIGLSTIFSGNTFSYSSVALTDCQVFLVEKTALLNIISRNGMFAFGLMRRYTELNNNLYNSIKTILYKQMNGRLANTLLYIAGFKQIENDIFTLLSRKDLAEFSGISTESTVKLLKSFEKDSLIKLYGKDIDILDKAKLLDIIKKG